MNINKLLNQIEARLDDLDDIVARYPNITFDTLGKSGGLGLRFESDPEEEIEEIRERRALKRFNSALLEVSHMLAEVIQYMKHEGIKVGSKSLRALEEEAKENENAREFITLYRATLGHLRARLLLDD